MGAAKWCLALSVYFRGHLPSRANTTTSRSYVPTKISSRPSYTVEYRDCMCARACVCVCVFVHLCVCVCLCVCLCCVYLRMHMCACVYVHVSVHCACVCVL